MNVNLKQKGLALQCAVTMTASPAWSTTDMCTVVHRQSAVAFLALGGNMSTRDQECHGHLDN